MQSSYRKLRAHIFKCQPKANSQQILGQDYTCPQSGPNVFLPARLSQRLHNFLTTSWVPCIQLWEPTKGISHLNHHRCYIKGTKKHADITDQQMIFTTSVNTTSLGAVLIRAGQSEETHQLAGTVRQYKCITKPSFHKVLHERWCISWLVINLGDDIFILDIYWMPSIYYFSDQMYTCLLTSKSLSSKLMLKQWESISFLSML